LDTQHKSEDGEGDQGRTRVVKSVRLIISSEADIVYHYLENKSAASKVERSVFNSIRRKIELIRSNCMYGSQVPKNLIPHVYKVEYQATNLFHVELANFWRMVYTLRNDKIKNEVIVLVLGIFDHNTYNKKFGYSRH
jgi:hypothetical protein